MANCGETCDYVARKQNPSNWHGDDSIEWKLDYNAPMGLEQEVWECPHEALDGGEYCPFHTDPKDVPDDVDEGEQFVEVINNASAAEDEKTARRRKEFVGATFGAFDIEEATLDAGDEHPIRLDHARFARGVNAKNTVFEHSLFARGVRFETSDGEATSEVGTISFEDAEFGEGEVSFWSAEFGEGEVSFGSAEFGEGEVSFFMAKFGEGEVSFEDAEFGEGEVSFEDAEFGEGEVSFDSAIVNASISFLDTWFDSDSTVNLSGAEFRDFVVFGFDEYESVSYAQHSLDLSGATFRRELDLRSGTKSNTRTEQADSREPQFRFVFAGEVNFSNATFRDGVDFSKVRFPADADFSGATLEDADFSDADVTGTEDISKASFNGANLTGANFTHATLAGASFERARLTRAELLWANFSGAKLYGALLGNARINDRTEFWLDESDTRRKSDGSLTPVYALRRLKMAFREREPYCPYDPRYRGSDSEPNLEKAGEVYATLESLANDNSLVGMASVCFLGRKDIQLREYWRDGDPLMFVRSLMTSLVARYGESPARVLGTGVITVLICGLTYYAFSLVEHADTEEPVTLFESFYFSGLTFTTLGYGDFNPANSAGQVLAVAETSIGVVLLAILVFVFGRRATR